MLINSEWAHQLHHHSLRDSQQLGWHTKTAILLALGESWLHEKRVVKRHFLADKALMH